MLSRLPLSQPLGLPLHLSPGWAAHQGRVRVQARTGAQLRRAASASQSDIRPPPRHNHNCLAQLLLTTVPGGGAKGRTRRPTHQQPPRPPRCSGQPGPARTQRGHERGTSDHHHILRLLSAPARFTPSTLHSEHLSLARAGVRTLRFQTPGLVDLRVEKPGQGAAADRGVGHRRTSSSTPPGQGSLQ